MLNKVSHILKPRELHILSMKEPKIFSSKADFEYSVMAGVVIIYDLNQGKISVTNDIENILLDLKESIADLSSKRIIYQDSNGIYDEIVINSEGDFIGFNYLGEKNLYHALRVLKGG